MSQAIERFPAAIPGWKAPLAQRGRRRMVVWGAALLGVGAVLAGGSSILQSWIFSRLAEHARAEVVVGRSGALGSSGAGPYDRRHGYRELPRFVDRLESRGWQVETQMAWSPALRALHRIGLAGPFREPSRPGLLISGRHEEVLFDARHPPGYGRFEEIPPVVVATLLYIEDRHLLVPEPRTRNPAVEWDRLLRAVVQYPLPGRGPGGSTIATQLEKLRHSPGGFTASPADKLRQMFAASLRAYRDGPDTLAARRELVVDYLNALPLGAAPGLGEVTGLDRGLIAWFGADPAQTDVLLHGIAATRSVDADTAQAYRRVLALILAARRPTALLTKERARLDDRVDAYLRLLSADGTISADLAHAAAEQPLAFETPPPPDLLVARKPAAPVRARLTAALGVDGYAALDALDLHVESSFDPTAQSAAAALLRGLSDPTIARQAGLVGHRLLSPSDDPGKIVWSFALYERGEQVNRVLAQIDNGSIPLDVHTGVRLDLGSVAKLRTVLLYLERVAAVQDALRGRSADELHAAAELARARRDPITPWIARMLSEEPDLDLSELIERALDRRYSAHPGEAFFTGGGVHRFRNFDDRHDDRALSVREAFRHSVNLPFIRLMRDVIRHLESQAIEAPSGLEFSRRMGDLARFADHESRVYLRRFFERYRGLSRDALLERLLEERRPTPRQLAVILRSLAPELGPGAFAEQMRRWLPSSSLADAQLADLHAGYSPERFDLADRGYLARMHPLELWTLARLYAHPDEAWEDHLEASRAARFGAYRWLFRSKRTTRQDQRIAAIREMDAFEEVLWFWRRLGYPFETITPSLAATLGSAGERPAALCELLGILVNDGVEVPTRRIERLRFAAQTPYETSLVPRAAEPRRVIRSEVAVAARALLRDAVESGTGRRALGALVAEDGLPIPIAGKTGTGDHRRKTFDRAGRVVQTQFVSRGVAFAFLAGDRHFGIVTAHVSGDEAEGYRFTSALAVQGFRALAPVIQEAIETTRGRAFDS